MRAVLLCLALCLAIASAQLQFTGTFELRHPLMQGGIVRGEIQYSWTQRNYRLFFPTSGFQEIYAFNPLRGYGVTERPFLNQWVYKSGRTCACETGPVDFGMPQLFISAAGVLSNYTATGATRDINGVTCAQYSLNAGAAGNVQTLFWDATGNKVCRAVFKDFREMTFTTVSTTPPQATIFTPPAGCKCGQPVDISIVLDRSGSISIAEFINQKAFVVGFTKMFSYGPYGANLALVHFNTPAWTTLKLVEGVTDLNVQRSVDALACCTNSTDTTKSCCCCGTSISRGMRLGADELATGRSRVEKVLLVITDGYHNHDYLGNACAENSTACRNDLAAAVTYVKATAGSDVKIYAVGVGADRDVSMDELLIISDNHPERVIRYTDFTNLAQNSLDLVARACQENLNPCGGCCGFCVCGQCQAPDACDQLSYCAQNNVSGVCCKQTPRSCDNPADQCQTYACNEAQKACLATPVTCKPDTDCFKYKCEPATGVCNTQQLCNNVAECAVDTDCNDQNACTRDWCGTDLKCKWESIEATCNDADACTVDTCDPKSGCVNTAVAVDYCDDRSNCTIDSCDKALGCVHQQVNCTDDNACTVDTCDPFKGCVSVPRICPNNGDNKCALAFCINGTCTTRNATSCVPIAAVAAGLTTAAIIGIIIAVVLCVAGVGGGGAYAYSQAAGSGSVAPVANNPIYVGSGAQGTNPLYRG